MVFVAANVGVTVSVGMGDDVAVGNGRIVTVSVGFETIALGWEQLTRIKLTKAR